MTLPSGSRFGSYEILALIGAGAMGEVYRARDTRLERDVAVKLLPRELMNNAERLARFRREARVLAGLNHPNIATIHGVEESADGPALVMELVDGETLVEVCARRRSDRVLPISRALDLVRQLAAALEAAHEKSIVHRDLKPANVKINAAGVLKVLDFGLAKMLEKDGAHERAGATTIADTRHGAILGTAAYMSPEQARGLDVDASTDVWAFGCVLFELLAGTRAFEGETMSDTIAAVLVHEPEWAKLPADVPSTIRRLLQRCLQKDRRQRLREMSAARILVEDALSAVDPTASSPGGERRARRSRTRLVWLGGLAAGVLVVAVAALVWSRTAPVPLETRLDIATPPTTDPASFALSPDARKVVFVASAGDASRLWLRMLDSATATPLAGTDAAYAPFWSPDSRSVGFFAAGKLRRIDLDTQSVQVLADATAGRGGAWNEAGDILFAPQYGPIFRIAASGGERTQVTRPDPQSSHRFPVFLPDGRHFIYFELTSPGPVGLKIGTLDGDETRHLVDADARGAYVEPGFVLFPRQGTLYAQRFDAERRELRGNPMPVAADVMVNPTNIPGSAALSAASTGLFAYRTGPALRSQLVWLDRSGRALGEIGDADMRDSVGLELSPDGRRVAMSRTLDGNADVWLLETARGTLMRLTTAPGADIDAVWSPDGSRLIFVSTRQSAGAIYEKPASGAADEVLVLDTPTGAYNVDWSPSGRFLLFDTQEVTTRHDMWMLPLEGPREASVLLRTAFDEMSGQFSPDGEWVAYQSNESGRFEIYVRPFPGPGAKWAVSTSGGIHVRWRHDGRELFFLGPDNQLMAAPIELDSEHRTVTVGDPAPLFTARVGTIAPVDAYRYAVAAAGERFLVNTVSEDTSPSPITVVQNWRPQR